MVAETTPNALTDEAGNPLTPGHWRCRACGWVNDSLCWRFCRECETPQPQEVKARELGTSEAAAALSDAFDRLSHGTTNLPSGKPHVGASIADHLRAANQGRPDWAVERLEPTCPRCGSTLSAAGLGKVKPGAAYAVACTNPSWDAGQPCGWTGRAMFLRSQRGVA